MLPQHILVPLDFSAPSEQALDSAIELAHKLEARVTLLHVVHPPTLGTVPEVGQGVAYASLMEQLEADANQAMDTSNQRARDAGLKSKSALIHGVPFQQIVDFARDQQADLIIMGTHGHTGLKHVLLGSVAEKVVRLAPCAVLVTRHPEKDGET
jgi:nucleotide-binding universal stress UspA family protein